MAGEIKISALPLAGAATDADVTAGVQTGATVKQTNSALATYMRGKIDLNSAYAVTPSFTLNITSGLTVLGTSYVISNSAVSPQASAIFEIDSTTQGFLMPRMTATQMNAISLPSTGLEVFNTTANAPYFYNGSAWIASGGSSLTIQGTVNQVNVALAGSTYTLSTPQNINTTANFQVGTLGINLSSTLNASAVLEADSTTRGFLQPRMTLAQRNAISTPATGLSLYNTNYNTINYYDGTSWQQILNTQNVSGSGTVTVTDNGDGTIDVFGSGGGPVPDPSFAAYSVINNSAPRPATTSFVAVPVSSGFTDVSDQNFTSQTMTIAGVNTVGSTYTGAVTTNFVVNQSCVLRPTGSLFREYYYAIAILRAGGSIETTAYQAYANTSTVLVSSPASMSGVVQLATGDTVFTQINSSASDGNSPTWTITSEVCIAAGAIPNTDGLSQGSNNFYLSQNGGTSLASKTGSVTSGNLAQFSGTSGLVADSGIVAANVLTTATSAGGDLSGTYPNPTVAKVNAVTYNSNTVTDGQIPIGATSGSSMTYATITGSTNQVNVANGSHSITLSLPQSIATTSTPQFSQELLGPGQAMALVTRLNLTGTDSSTSGPIQNFYTATDLYPLFQVLPWTHGNVNLSFDAYFDGTNWISSKTSSNYRLSKDTDDKFYLRYKSGVTAGSTIAWSDGWSVDTSGNFNIPGLSVSQIVATDASKNLVSTGFAPSSVILSSGSYADPSWITSLSGSKLTAASVDLTTKVTGTLPVVNGGTGQTTYTNGQLLIGNSSGNTLTKGVILATAAQTTVTNGGGTITIGTAQSISAASSPTFAGLTVSGLTASTLVATDGSKILTSSVSGLSPAFTGLNLSGLTINNMVVTDGSKNLASAALPLGINTLVTSNSATQSMNLQTRYIVTYTGGQMVGTLPAATGSGKTVDILGASTASTSGWRVNAPGSDTIQFNAAVSAGGGNIVSTAASATDCATFIDSASGKWIVYPAQGLNLTVT